MRRGFWWSHVGWFLCSKHNDADPRLIRDLIGFRELLFLNRFHALPPAALAVSVLLLGTLLHIFAPGLHTGPAQMLVWGFCVSTVLVYHGTFLVNSLAHVFGRRRFPTKDDSRNNFLIALITFGEGWHNNHHYAPSSERQGLYWWEIDLSHCILQVLNWCGVVWDLRKPPPRVYEIRQVSVVSVVKAVPPSRVRPAVNTSPVAPAKRPVPPLMRPKTRITSGAAAEWRRVDDRIDNVSF
jgi:stearoyl-CoA desaturase (delta-9 desaturase)